MLAPAALEGTACVLGAAETEVHLPNPLAAEAEGEEGDSDEDVADDERHAALQTISAMHACAVLDAPRRTLEQVRWEPRPVGSS